MGEGNKPALTRHEQRKRAAPSVAAIAPVSPAFAKASARQPSLLRYEGADLACPAEAAKQRRLVPLADSRLLP
jgi:hypothetical protein